MRTTCVAVASLLVVAGLSFSAAPKFEKVSEHYYYLQSEGEIANAGAFVTEDGVLLIDPPGEANLPGFLDALRRLTSRPVRWVVSTDYREERSGGSAYFSRLGAAVLSGKELRRLATATAKSESKENPAERKTTKSDEPRKEGGPRLTFARQMRLFPGGVEVRIIALQYKAQTAGDVVVFIPAEKVIHVGHLFVPGSFPEIDAAGGEGSASGWVDGMRQAIDAVPLLKPAIPQPKSESSKTPTEEKTLEESVVVISGSGRRSNLQDMKSMLEAAQKIRAEAVRTAAAGRSREAFLASPSLNAYRGYNNFEIFAGQLFDSLPPKRLT